MNARSILDRFALPIACTLAWVAHAAIFLRWLPSGRGTLGHDYAYFFPALLNGYFWFMENGLAVPWFTPAMCGGLPLYPNPESLYYSVPQFLTFASDPLAAVRGTFVLFAAAGVLGTALLLRGVFQLGRASSFFGATLFLFNGYFAHRMLIGHLGFHSVMLVPLIAYWVLRPLPAGRLERRWRFGLDVVLAGSAVTYMLQSGNHDFVPTVLATAGVTLLALARGVPWASSMIRIAGAFALAGLMSASKLAAGFAFLGSFPRSGYPVPGTESIFGALRLALESLFWFPPQAEGLVVNSAVALERHEFEYGLTLIPALVLVAALAQWGHRLVRSRTPSDSQLSKTQRSRPGGIPCAAIVGLVVLLCIPIAMNLHSPAATAIIKQIPILKNSSSFIRWLGVYIPIVTVAAALALESLGRARLRLGLAAAGVVSVIAINAFTEREHYSRQPYDASQLVRATTEARRSGVPTPIAGLQQLGSLNRNDAMANGTSALRCYEAIFGYGLEWFPANELRAGPVEQRSDGYFNLLDPSCFVFPEANACRPGTRMRVADPKRAERFVHYRTIAFERSFAQVLADRANVAALAAVAVFTLAWCGNAAASAMRRRQGAGGRSSGQRTRGPDKQARKRRESRRRR